ncbi:MAG: BrnT family toxin [Candidatus Thiothrix moscowensis]|nr:BrnT family toxin [Candidatus Thiothrix moscowensis]
MFGVKTRDAAKRRRAKNNKGATVQYNFEWNPIKAETNRRKHGIGFEQAAEVFLDPLQMTLFDDSHSDDEERWLTLGKTRKSGLLVVVHTLVEYHDNQTITVRIISARPATRHEQQQYEAG